MLIIGLWFFFIIATMIAAKSRRRSADRWGALAIFIGPFALIFVLLAGKAESNGKEKT